MIQTDYNQPSYVEMINQSILIEKVQYPQLDPILLNQQKGDKEIKNVQIVENIVPINKTITRAHFLTKYYCYSILQYIGVLSIFLLTQDFRFVEILCIVEYSPFEEHQSFYYASEEYKNGEDYRKLFGRYDSMSRYQFRWTYFVFLALTIGLTLQIIIKRSSRKSVCDYSQSQQVKNQRLLYIIYTILIGLDLGGFACISKGSWRNDAKIFYTKIVCAGLVGNALLQIILIQLNKAYSYGKLSSILIYILFPINNFLFAFDCNYNKPILVLEVVIVYGIYYFNQLNTSLLKSPEDLQKGFNILEYLHKCYSKTELNLPEQVGQNLAQVKDDKVIINKNFFLGCAIICGYLVFLILLGFVDTGICIALSGLTLLSILDTQVASTNDEDVLVAVCLTYVDFFSPIKNFIRSLSI